MYPTLSIRKSKLSIIRPQMLTFSAITVLLSATWLELLSAERWLANIER